MVTHNPTTLLDQIEVLAEKSIDMAYGTLSADLVLDFVEKLRETLSADATWSSLNEKRERALKAWQSKNKTREYSEFYSSFNDGFDAGYAEGVRISKDNDHDRTN